MQIGLEGKNGMPVRFEVSTQFAEVWTGYIHNKATLKELIRVASTAEEIRIVEGYEKSNT